MTNFLSETRIKKPEKIVKKLLTCAGRFGKLIEPAQVGILCVEAGDCSQSEVTSVEYVRHSVLSECTIGRLESLNYARVYRRGEE